MSNPTPQSIAKAGEKLARSGKTGLAKKKLEQACTLAETLQKKPESITEITSLAQCLITLENLENSRKIDPRAFQLFIKSLNPT